MSSSEQLLNNYEQERKNYSGEFMKQKLKRIYAKQLLEVRKRKVVPETLPRERIKEKASKLFSKCEAADVRLGTMIMS